MNKYRAFKEEDGKTIVKDCGVCILKTEEDKVPLTKFCLYLNKIHRGKVECNRMAEEFPYFKGGI